jgi:hypothetical protein
LKWTKRVEKLFMRLVANNQTVSGMLLVKNET